MFIRFLLVLALVPCQACVPLAATTAAVSGTALAKDERTMGRILDDQTTDLKAMKVLHADKVLQKNNHVVAVTYNNNVLLIGQVRSEALKQRAQNVIQREFPNLNNIFNELSIEAPSTLLRQSNDSLITTHVKAQLLAHRKIRSGRIKVITENATVYLLGLIQSSQVPLVLDITRRVNGVRKVVPLFETLPSP